MDLFGLNKTILFHEKMVWGAPGTRRYKKILTQTSDILRLVALIIWTCRILFINVIQHIRHPIIIYVLTSERKTDRDLSCVMFGKTPFKIEFKISIWKRRQSLPQISIWKHRQSIPPIIYINWPSISIR